MIETIHSIMIIYIPKLFFSRDKLWSTLNSYNHMALQWPHLLGQNDSPTPPYPSLHHSEPQYLFLYTCLMFITDSGIGMMNEIPEGWHIGSFTVGIENNMTPKGGLPHKDSMLLLTCFSSPTTTCKTLDWNWAALWLLCCSLYTRAWRARGWLVSLPCRFVTDSPK